MKKKMYILDMFPYPSGAGLHVGHVEGYTATDILSRFMRMRGFEVLHPMGWDSFGLPAENYAIKTGIHPHKTTETAIVTFRKQMDHMGFSYDWDRELAAHRPDYYRWTQWLFQFLYKKGLAYRGHAPVNWCPSCQTVLANEQVVEGKCERCDTAVIQKDMEQWFFKITQYADRLLADLDKLDWPESTKQGQRNWIGRSEGINITYQVAESKETITCFTTTPVNFGATFVVVAPEHEIVNKITTEEHKVEIEAYIRESKKHSELERTINREKTGIFTGAYVLNHVTGKNIPVYVADFALAHVGTGAVQGCPGHDVRDFEFAKKYGIPIQRVVVGEDGDTSPIEKKEQLVVKGMKGKMVNSDFLNGMEFKEAMIKTMDYFEEEGFGKRVVNYKIRDWLVSRQRYWGAPVPMVYCETDDWQCVPDSALPVKLPEDVDFKPTGESPLAASATFQHGAVCPVCNKPAKREIDTIDTFVDSSWYFLRFADPHNTKEFASPEKLEEWLPVDVYVGGAEHTVLHLLYSRFITKALFDAGIVSFDEPFLKLRHPGTILAEDSRKMSKRWGNVVNPDDEIKKYGADAVRMFEMFIGPFKDMKPWSTSGLRGVSRFLKRVEIANEKVDTSGVYVSHDQQRLFHQTLQFVTAGIENFQFNTCVSAYMEMLNALQKDEKIQKDVWEGYLKIMAPFAPFLTEELWKKMGNKIMIHNESWPILDEALLVKDTVEIPVTINGKMRGILSLGLNSNQDEAMEKALKEPVIAKYLDGAKIVKVIYVPRKILNVLTA